MQIADAKAIMNEFHVPIHIRKHCEAVANVAQQIAKGYIQKGQDLNVENLVSACLLHDLFRIVDISEESYKKLCKNAEEYDKNTWDITRMRYKGKTHSEIAYEFLEEKGEEELANLIKKHYFVAIIDPNDKAFTLEEKILTYADKRVLHENIVSLKERFEDGAKRYNKENEDSNQQKAIYNAYFDLEKELFDPIDLKPEDIKE